ncbi:hypothetical protein BO78DRAFT_367131 [Aspergillus sclerotiicarbonarius CBS 121057]|uniref:BTB domain-containing protein n=1 Tax=Aspergillus sclerotiicarbonarius (strain CBS 121057 / IBT 28362) TaxID=1448318 RepID=A0A319EAS1_ASPSB|nr:hypothetical protein BO78DRAFT_367131 [Aspergillus sclerotiicarbonarius CBS 121057]
MVVNGSNMSARYAPKPEFDDEVEEYEQPELSPYETRLVIVLMGPSERKYSIPEYYLKQSPVFADILSTYPNFITRTTPCIALPDIDDDITHTIVHYLHTGTYQTLRQGGDWTKTEYRRSVLAYSAASKYELRGLLILAKKYMQKLDKDLSIFDILSVARKAFGKIPDYDQWFFSTYIKSRLAAAFDEDEDLFESPRFQYLLGAEPGFVTCLVQAMVAIYEAKISELKQFPRINGVHDGEGEGMNGEDDSGYTASPGRGYNKAVIFIEETLSDRPPSEEPISEAYPESVPDDTGPMEAFPALTDDVYVPETHTEERYAPADEPIAEEPFPKTQAQDQTHSEERENAPATDRWNAWRGWASKDRDWYREVHEPPVPEKPAPEAPVEEAVPEYSEIQRTMTEETGTESVPADAGKKLGKKSRKKKMRALFSSAEEPKAEPQAAY